MFWILWEALLDVGCAASFLKAIVRVAHPHSTDKIRELLSCVASVCTF